MDNKKVEIHSFFKSSRTTLSQFNSYYALLFMKCIKGLFVVIFETSCNLIVFQLGASAEFFISTYYITRPFCAKTQKRASEMISYFYIINLKVTF